MSLAPGARLGVYEIVDALGAGGMGEVYRALDTKLGRSVAIKILPDAVSIDAERIGRFEREAKVLASLNHPNIAGLFGMEQDGGRVFLIMELVDGDTLADRIALTHAGGGFAINELLAIAIQIAEGVEAAHEKGIVHRDLKPANIKIGADGRVKVLDFGLARAMASEPAGAAPPGLTHSPTLSMMATQAGMILGTAAYMSPEQAKGLQADHRSDVFSFGVVLYEMMTGRQPFKGETAPDILASVLARDPDLTVIAPSTHPRLRELVVRCLEKNPRRRWQAIGDVRAELEIVAASPAAPGAPIAAAPPRPWWQSPLTIVTAALVVVAAALVLALRPRSSAPVDVTRVSISLPENQTLTGAARQLVTISQDGRRIAYVADRRIWVRDLAEFDARPVVNPETPEVATQVLEPALSPSGEFLAFYSQRDEAIKRIAVSGGAPLTVCAATSPLSIVWHGDSILFTATAAQRPDGNAGIYRVAASGGSPERVVAAGPNERLSGPQFLPDGEHVLFSVGAERDTLIWDKARIAVESIKTHERHFIIEDGVEAQYLPTGHIVYALNGVLLAVRFDVRTLSTIGGLASVVEGVMRTNSTGSPAVQVAIASNGTLAYFPGPVSSGPDSSTVAIFDFAGRSQPLNLPSRQYRWLRVSPDGKRIAYTTDSGKESAIWVYELSGATSPTRLTFEGHGLNRYPVWTADGGRVTFQSDREGDRGLFWQRADGSGPAERLTKAGKDEEHIPNAWSPGGGELLFDRATATVATLSVFSLKDRTSVPFGGVESPRSALTGAMFSPDGRWVTYSTRQGRSNSAVFVQPFPATGARFQISQDPEDGHHPVWFRDGGRIAYTPGPGQAMSVVRVSTTGGEFVVSPGDPTARPFLNAAPISVRPWDLTPDGQHFVGTIDPQWIVKSKPATPEIRVVLNWFEDVKRRLPAR